jgi:hypothetical protein
MKLALTKGSTSVTVNVFVRDSTSTTGAGKTGLAYNSAGLTAYYVRPRAAAAAIVLATQTAAGAWASGGFVEIDATNMPGWYRLDIPDAVLAIGADFTGIHLQGAAGMAPLPLEIQLTGMDLNNATTGGLANLDAAVSSVPTTNDIAIAVLTTAMAESYAADGEQPTLAQALYMLLAVLCEASISGTTMTVKKLNGVTTAATFTTNSATEPTSITRAS